MCQVFVEWEFLQHMFKSRVKYLESRGIDNDLNALYQNLYIQNIHWLREHENNCSLCDSPF